MTPLQESLTNYRAIAPKAINATNQLTFNAIGHGDHLIQVPNECSNSKILLRDVLHTPDIAQTLISIRLISDAGYSVTFKDGACTIRDSNGAIVGKIPEWDGFYKVDRGECLSASTHIANDSIILMDAH